MSDGDADFEKLARLCYLLVTVVSASTVNYTDLSLQKQWGIGRWMERGK